MQRQNRADLSNILLWVTKQNASKNKLRQANGSATAKSVLLLHFQTPSKLHNMIKFSEVNSRRSIQLQGKDHSQAAECFITIYDRISNVWVGRFTKVNRN